MPGSFPIACVGDITDPEVGLFGTVALAPGGPGKVLGASTVLAGGRPVASVGFAVSPHGNYTDPKLPGFNPTCASAILSGLHTGFTVLVEGKPVAVAAPGKQGTMASCTHYIATVGCPTVIVGLVA
jgi:hypothetical protein